MIWKISKSSHFKLLIKCFQAIVIKLQREKFFKVALLSYKKMALFKTNHTGPSSTGSLGLHQISADIGSPVDWNDKFVGQIWHYEVSLHSKISHLVIEIIKIHQVWPNPEQFSNHSKLVGISWRRVAPEPFGGHHSFFEVLRTFFG